MVAESALSGAGGEAPLDNWLFGRQTPYCNASLVPSYDDFLGVQDPGGKTIMSVLYLVSTLLVVVQPRRREEVEVVAEDTEQPLKSEERSSSAGSGRWVFLDVARIACVFCVVAEHSGGTVYSAHNTGFVTHWVLQWLFVISGIAFMMSKATFLSYFARCRLTRAKSPMRLSAVC